MPRIVFVLEQLEELAEKCSSDQQRIKELMVERESLIIHTKRDEAIQRQLQEVCTRLKDDRVLLFFYIVNPSICPIVLIWGS